MTEHKFKKKFGQNFLKDKNLLDAIVRDAGVKEQDEVLEIGAGAGALTVSLSKYAKRVVSYEIDRELEDTLNSLQLKNVEFVFTDALKTNIENIESHFEGKYKLVANLPYYITTPLIFKFLEESERLTSMTIMVQKEVAQRIVSSEGGKDYGILSVMLAFYGQAEIMREVNRNMFYPVPNVDSAVVRINIDKNKFSGIDKARFSKFIKAAFAMRRKTLLNNLSRDYDKKILQEKLTQDTLRKRAEQFSIDEFVELYKKLL